MQFTDAGLTQMHTFAYRRRWIRVLRSFSDTAAWRAEAKTARQHARKTARALR